MTTEQLKNRIDNLLADNTELAGYYAARERDRALPYIPEYHFSAPGGYMNDPCGYCFYKGLYHLFYQFVPENGKGLVWGHAVSVDNIRWLDLPCAVAPTIEDCCCSGGILIEDDRAVICYAGALAGTNNSGIHILESRDDLLLHFERISSLPTVYTFDKDGNKNPYNAFDPFIFRDNGRYCMITGGGGSLPHPYDPEKLDFRREYIFTSDDLVNWEYHHVFVEGDRYNVVGDDGACPYFLPVGNGRHILLNFSHRQGGKYLVGDYDSDRLKFYARGGGAFNVHSWYSGVHAPSAFPDGNGGVTAIFNINYGYKTECQNMVMSLPRRMTVNDRYELSEEPAVDTASLHSKHCAGSLTVPANTETVIGDVNGKSLELKINIGSGSRKSGENFIPDNLIPMVEVRVLRSPDAREYTSIRSFRNRSVMNWAEYPKDNMHWANSSESVLEVDTSYSSLSPDVAIHPTESATYMLGKDEDIELRIFVDRSIVEVFGNGKKCISVRSYPTLPNSETVSVISRGVPVRVDYEAWNMKL